MKRIFLFLAPILALSGCTFYKGPEEKLHFSKLENISQLSGAYENQGDPEGFLSRELWGTDESAQDLKHDQIDLIVVETIGESVSVKAIEGDCVIFRKEYLQGTDFEITDGKIVLMKEFDLLTRGGDDPMLGPSYGKAVIGLDESGDGAFRAEGWLGGIVYSVFPVMASVDTEIRFRRVDKKGPFLSCQEEKKREVIRSNRATAPPSTKPWQFLRPPPSPSDEAAFEWRWLFKSALLAVPAVPSPLTHRQGRAWSD
jgi:hypothetical protein